MVMVLTPDVLDFPKEERVAALMVSGAKMLRVSPVVSVPSKSTVPEGISMVVDWLTVTGPEKARIPGPVMEALEAPLADWKVTPPKKLRRPEAMLIKTSALIVVLG